MGSFVTPIFLAAFILLNASLCLSDVTNGRSSHPKAIIFQLERLNPQAIAKYLPNQGGAMAEAVGWTDNSGYNVLVITQSVTGKRLEPGYSSEICAVQYRKGKDSLAQVWRIKDFNYADSEIEYVQKSLRIIDLDKDSVAESSFFYTILSADRQTTKFMMHTKGKKLAIRGYWDIDINYEHPKLDKIEIDRDFEVYPKIFKDFALREWGKATDD